MKAIYWIPIGLLALLILFGVVAYYQGKPAESAKLSHHDEKKVQAQVVKDNKDAATKRAASERTASAAVPLRAEATKAAGQAATLRQQTHHLHATPTPTTDTAAARIQRALSHYGR